MGNVGAAELIVWLLVGLITGAIGLMIGGWKNRAAFGFLAGFLLGPLGWLVLLLMPRKFPKCGACQGDVVPGAVKCQNCGSDLPIPAT